MRLDNIKRIHYYSRLLYAINFALIYSRLHHKSALDTITRSLDAILVASCHSSILRASRGKGTVELDYYLTG